MFDNSPTNIIDYPCILHKNERVTHICLDLRCTSNPYLCSHCFNGGFNQTQHGTHEESLVLMSELSRSLSAKIEYSRLELKRLYTNTIGRRENEEIIGKVEMRDQGNMAIEAHIKNLKIEIEKEAEHIHNEFQKRLQISK